MPIKSKKQASKLKSYRLYENGDYSYKTKDGFVHLIRNGVNLLEGLEAINCYSYNNGEYTYFIKDNYWHLIRNGVDLWEGLEINYYCLWGDGDYDCMAQDGRWYRTKTN